MAVAFAACGLSLPPVAALRRISLILLIASFGLLAAVVWSRERNRRRCGCANCAGYPVSMIAAAVNATAKLVAS